MKRFLFPVLAFLILISTLSAVDERVIKFDTKDLAKARSQKEAYEVHGLTPKGTTHYWWEVKRSEVDEKWCCLIGEDNVTETVTTETFSEEI